MKRKALIPYKAVTILLPLLLLVILIAKDFLFQLAGKLPLCPVYTHLHLYCPACGNTRCVKALLNGDLITAIRYNISPIVFGFFLLLAYLELATYSFGHHIKLLPRKLHYYIIVLLLLILYVGLRNFIPFMTL